MSAYRWQFRLWQDGQLIAVRPLEPLPFSIGRGPAAQLRLNAPELADQHCLLLEQGTRLLAVSQGPGLLRIDGQAVSWREVSSGCCIEFGPFVLMLQEEAATEPCLPASTAEPPPIGSAATWPTGSSHGHDRGVGHPLLADDPDERPTLPIPVSLVAEVLRQIETEAALSRSTPANAGSSPATGPPSPDPVAPHGCIAGAAAAPINSNTNDSIATPRWSASGGAPRSDASAGTASSEDALPLIPVPSAWGPRSAAPTLDLLPAVPEVASWVPPSTAQPHSFTRPGTATAPQGRPAGLLPAGSATQDDEELTDQVRVATPSAPPAQFLPVDAAQPTLRSTERDELPARPAHLTPPPFYLPLWLALSAVVQLGFLFLSFQIEPPSPRSSLLPSRGTTRYILARPQPPSPPRPVASSSRGSSRTEEGRSTRPTRKPGVPTARTRNEPTQPGATAGQLTTLFRRARTTAGPGWDLGNKNQPRRDDSSAPDQTGFLVPLAGTGRGDPGTGPANDGLPGLFRQRTGGGGGGIVGQPLLTAEPPRVRGTLSAGAIRKVLDKQHGEVRRCYMNRLQSKPELSGRITVSLVIDATGQVSKISSFDQIRDEVLSQCVLNRFRTLVFPRPRDGEVVVNFSFTFQVPG